MTLPGSRSGSRGTSSATPIEISPELASTAGLQPEDYGVLIRLVGLGPIWNVNLKALVTEMQSSGWRMSQDRLAQCLKRLKATGYVQHMPEFNEETGRPVWTLRAFLVPQTSSSSLPTQDRSEQVYVIRDRKTRHVKIGISIDPRKRLSSLRTGSPTGMDLLWTSPGGRPLERYLHDRFSAHRIRGEWFDFSGCDVLETISRAAAEFGDAR